LAKYFGGYSRIPDIERALKLSKSKNAKVMEIGCGDGRDAQDIIKIVSEYIGIDPSEGLINIAKSRLPKANFAISDAISYVYPTKLDVIYAFASLLHVNKMDFKKIGEKAYDALKQNGIFYISLKERPKYQKEIKSDKYGKRLFYYYNLPLMKKLLAGKFECIYEENYKIADTPWVSAAFKKI
jgi:SAM-dependent methyltransferase